MTAPRDAEPRLAGWGAVLGSLFRVLESPRDTVLGLVERPPPPAFVASVFGLGLVSSSLLDRDWSRSTPFDLAGGPGRAALFALATGAACLVSLYVGGALFARTGRALGGSGTAARLRVALAWGMVPHVWAMLYRLPLVLRWPGMWRLAGGASPVAVYESSRGFDLEWTDLGAPPFLVLVAFGLVDAVVNVYGLVILSKALGAAHGISGWRGFGCWLLGMLAVGLVAAALALAGVALFPGLIEQFGPAAVR